MSNETRSGRSTEGGVPLSREERLRLKEERRRRQAERDERKREKQGRTEAKAERPTREDRANREGRLNREDRPKREDRSNRENRPKREGLPKKERHSARRVNRVAEFVGAKSYLEIGVAKGKTFLEVRVPRKVAVDPKFRFDVAPHRREGVAFHETTSDAFFAQHPKSEKFDVIFIDGLHIFDQALRDFRNSLEVSHDRTVWLIDDVMPVDEFSAMTDRVQARKLRWETGNESRAWHGDVYKVILAIHDLHPEFSYVTVTTDGNPQTIVWRAPRDHVVPAFGSVEAIDKVDFQEFAKRRELMNPRSDEEGLQMLYSSMKS